ncbi:hypothetical protein ACLKA6_000911 [Drosophila palustris]
MTATCSICNAADAFANTTATATATTTASVFVFCSGVGLETPRVVAGCRFPGNCVVAVAPNLSATNDPCSGNQSDN